MKNLLRKSVTVVLLATAGLVSAGAGVANAEPRPDMPRVTYVCDTWVTFTCGLTHTGN